MKLSTLEKAMEYATSLPASSADVGMGSLMRMLYDSNTKCAKLGTSLKRKRTSLVNRRDAIVDVLNALVERGSVVGEEENRMLKRA